MGDHTMARDWEQQFRDWARPPGKSEEDRSNNAVSAVRNAINGSPTLRVRNVTVFAHGSYKNNTNVRKDSDVDVAVLCTDSFFYDLPDAAVAQTFGISPASYDYSQFKTDVGQALVSHFGRPAVTRGNKAFDVRETTYHVEADVAPFFEHRRYSSNGTSLRGVELKPDRGGRVINWPDQHYANGVSKNKATGTRYKSIVRVLKALSNELTERGDRAGNVPGFLIECLVWNVPNQNFGHTTYKEDLEAALVFLYQNTRDDHACSEWGEVSELKYLFRASQNWTRQQANDFTVAVWNYAQLGSRT
jgi:hypothetical protein